MRLLCVSTFVGMLFVSTSVNAVLFECVDADGITLYSDLPCPKNQTQQSTDFDPEESSELDAETQRLLMGSWMQIYQDNVKVPTAKADVWHFSQGSYVIQAGAELSRTITYQLIGPLIETDDINIDIKQIDEKFLVLELAGSKLKFRRK